MPYTYIVHLVFSEEDLNKSCYFGPFETEEAAEQWLNDRPDDPELVDGFIYTMNAPKVHDAHL